MENISASEALNKLVLGNQRYREKLRCICDGTDTVRKETVSSQTPYAIIVGCSDSRVTPEIIFNETLGELFVIRVAGSVITQDGLASIEFGVANLGINLILIMGHEACGAITLALKPTSPKTSTAMKDLLSKIAVPKNIEGEVTPELINQTVLDNVAGNIEFVQNYIHAHYRDTDRDIRVVGGFYHLGDGSIDLLDV